MKNEYLESARLEGVRIGHCLREKMQGDEVDGIRRRLIDDTNKKDLDAFIKDLEGLERLTGERIRFIDDLKKSAADCSAWWDAAVSFCNATGSSCPDL